MTTTPPHRRREARRGVLLLLVLTALTFFIMLGTLMLVTATRSRTSARAFSDASNSLSSGSIQARTLLDEALMVLLRGSKGTLPGQITESILEDKYGTDIVTGTASPPAPMTTGTFANYQPILQTTLQNLSPAPTHPCDLNGRILTFKPDPNDGDVASYRILRTTTGGAGGYTVFLANTPTGRSPQLPKKPVEVLINGREFFVSGMSTAIEPYDSFDKDPWLAQIPLANSRPMTSGSMRPSYGTSVSCGDPSLAYDNDNDGVADGVLIRGTTGFLPDRPSPLGGTLQYEVSYLVLDLDGRLNVNAHGAVTPVVTGSTDWPTSVAGVNVGNLPVGSGFGPADVDASRVVATGSCRPGAPGFPGRWSNIVIGGTSIVQTASDPAIQRRPTPYVGMGQMIDGRYGADAGGSYVPGRPGSTTPSLQFWSLWGNSPTDLNVRMKTFVTATTTGPPTLMFYMPDRSKNDFTENPYAMRLDADGPRGTQVRQPSTQAGTPPSDSPFAVTELERVLRQFDADAGTLPPRLAVLLDDYAERSRMTVTTDSWDTPAITGDAMTKVRDYLRQFNPPSAPATTGASAAAASVYDVMSPDVTAGVRFDINRPVQHPVVATSLVPKIKEKFCQHLYTLLVALGQPANQQTAQWAANVCDFRDPDSTMTMFRYDTNPADGWTQGTQTVFGAERPEVLITETLAWNGYLSVVLYHPWAAWIVDKSTAANPTTGTPAEPVDPNLADPGNPAALDLTRKNSAGDSIWRLRVVGGAGLVPFGDTTVVTGADTAKCKLLPNGYVCVQSANDSGTPLPSVTVSTFTAATGNTKVVLERLADPTRPKNDTQGAGYNPYVTVDEATLNVHVDKSTAMMAANPKKQRNQTTLWKQQFSDASGAPDRLTGRAPWFHWPNRPFASVAELALVPTGDASGMLGTGANASPALNTSNLILDAVQVPSRFDGTSIRVGDDSLLGSVAMNEQVCSTLIPKWREPGRINVNTIAPNTGNASSPALDDAVWQALVGDAAPNINGGKSPFAGGSVAKTTADLLALGGGGGVYTDAPAAPRDNNPLLTYTTAMRVANAATVRSHVFAVWITLKTTDTSAGAAAPTYKRLFAIVDRSIPVGFSKGENLNVRDTVRLKRYLE